MLRKTAMVEQGMGMFMEASMRPQRNAAENFPFIFQHSGACFPLQ